MDVLMSPPMMDNMDFVLETECSENKENLKRRLSRLRNYSGIVE